ncbi:AraC family transcriptional regulator [Saccharospirillum sp. HFRX-1]|uniref:AraC family transcriptional regulator n=1 Tax=unclassified Saccharospirillum TaxID=2633430 RepID=UPI00372209BB
MDPLSDLLSLLKLRNYLSAGFDVGDDWLVQFPDQQQSIKCGAILNGDCWLAVEGVDEAVHLQAGDCFVLPWGRPFRLGSDLNGRCVPARDLFNALGQGTISTYQGGGRCYGVSSRFALSSQHNSLLTQLLPAIVHIREDQGAASLRWCVEQMMQEMRNLQAGSTLVIEHLAHMILIQALRLHQQSATDLRQGWLFALQDPAIGRALEAIHQQPAQRWTLQSMAEQAGQSRSSFAQHFRTKVGTPPLEYLTQWRMLLAGDRLQRTDDSVSSVALSLGYESESAFSTAFKRVMGCSPRQYSLQAAAATELAD